MKSLVTLLVVLWLAAAGGCSSGPVQPLSPALCQGWSYGDGCGG